MAEGYDSYGDAFRDYLPAAYGNIAMRGMQGEKTEQARRLTDNIDDDLEVIDFDEIEEVGDEYHRERRRGRKNYPDVDRFTHGTFSESIVDGVLSNYFIVSETEKKEFTKKQKIKTDKNYSNIESLAKSRASLMWEDNTPLWASSPSIIKRVNATHKANLYRKDPIFYAEFASSVTDKNNKPCCDKCQYYWPTHPLRAVAA